MIDDDAADILRCMKAWTLTSVLAPERVRTGRREADLLWYGPSTVLAARTNRGDVGAVRIAVRADRAADGLVTDVMVDEPFRQTALSVELIMAAEQQLVGLGATRVSGVILDGRGRSEPFLVAGYQPFRKTVVVEWNLAGLKDLERPVDLDVGIVDRINPEEVAEFIFSSYQPYWQWWKETGDEQAVGRAEYPVSESTDVRAKQRAANWDRVVAALRQFNTTVPQRMIIAQNNGHIVGLCDAKADPDDSMDWGVLIHRDSHSRQLGSALLKPALDWLRQQGLKTAQMTTTSGLDDYDPTVYLYVLVGGAQMRGEFLVLRKTLAKLSIL